MGGGSFSTKAYENYSRSTTVDRSTGRRKAVREVFTERQIHKELNPRSVMIRESCDSDDNPESTPIIIALDVTGSMGYIAAEMLNNQVGKLMNGIHDCPFITNPHIMFMAVGDYDYDSSPLQVSQFEADLRIAEQLKLVYNEQGGGGNNQESYHLPWYFADNHCKCDAITKRGKKGFIFTIGDECIPNELKAERVNRLMENANLQKDIPISDLYESVKKNWEVFHLMVEEGGGMRYSRGGVRKSWTNVIGNRALRVSDYNYIADVAVVAMDIASGADPLNILRNTQDDHMKNVLTRAFIPETV